MWLWLLVFFHLLACHLKKMATDASVLKHGVVGNENNGHAACCNTGGPGYATPLEAMSGPREALIYVTCVYTGTYIYTYYLHLLFILIAFFFLFFFIAIRLKYGGNLQLLLNFLLGLLKKKKNWYIYIFIGGGGGTRVFVADRNMNIFLF